MVITDIKRKGKSETYHVWVNDEYFALLEAEIIYKNKLKIGTEIEESKLNLIKKESDKLLCASTALNYISKSIKSEFQLKQYLKGKNFCEEAINEAIFKLKTYGYLNDEYFAKISANELSRTKGKRYIKNQLALKGISDDKIQNVLENLEGEDEACFNATKKWLRGKTLPLDNNSKQKLYRFLLSRGFEYGTIKKSLNKFNEEIDDNDWY